MVVAVVGMGQPLPGAPDDPVGSDGEVRVRRGDGHPSIPPRRSACACRASVARGTPAWSRSRAISASRAASS
ncbi:hypothetical protein [Ornithinimicrobium kibberense]|uniref:hypothetical protein n=1 Tax=Ornithinimicrobium kibberense TaxID=282060 RepID=UPI003608AFD7